MITTTNIARAEESVEFLLLQEDESGIKYDHRVTRSVLDSIEIERISEKDKTKADDGV